MDILSSVLKGRPVRELSGAELDALCSDIRSFLVDKISRSGGHLASNLGAVELTVALHRVYDTGRDRLVFDVGHQCYTHKLLTGRAEGFDHFRELGSMAGFPKPAESVHDAFIAGHASNSVSVALGMARARTLAHKDYDIVVVIGDGALNGGMSFEALSDAGKSGEPLVVVLNDNGMSINPAVGGLADMLASMRTGIFYQSVKEKARRLSDTPLRFLYRIMHKSKQRIKRRLIPDNMFDDFGLEYIGPVDGHDVARVETALRWARAQKKPCLVHVITTKGKGYGPAEQSPALFHGVGPFDAETGIPNESGESFSSVFGEELTALAENNASVTAITAAMTEGTGLLPFFRRFPERMFDVGIAEEHACAMAAGMASQGLIPVFAVYSTFLQRSFDMLMHDVALMGLHVVFAVDRAGLVGKDGETHQGVFDVAYLSAVPGLQLWAPSNFAELRSMLRHAVEVEKGPSALRYPRGGEGRFQEDTSASLSLCLREGKDAVIVSYGIQINDALQAAALLSGKGIEASVIKLNRLTDPDFSPAVEAVRRCGRLVVAEDVCREGCLGEKLLAHLAQERISLSGSRLLNLSDGIVPHGDVSDLKHRYGLDGEGICQAVEALYG